MNDNNSLSLYYEAKGIISLLGTITNGKNIHEVANIISILRFYISSTDKEKNISISTTKATKKNILRAKNLYREEINGI